MMPPSLVAWVVYAVVALCAAYSFWMFLPGSLKRRIATALMASMPRLRASHRLQKLAAQGGGCRSGCDSCGSSPANQPAHEHKVQLFRRAPASRAAPPKSARPTDTRPS